MAGYTKWREFCNGVFEAVGLDEFIRSTTFTTWDDISDYISATKVDKLREIYRCHKTLTVSVILGDLNSNSFSDVTDVDLFAAALGEESVPGSSLGPTFTCLIALEFRNKKFGDRFYYETSHRRTRFGRSQ